MQERRRQRLEWVRGAKEASTLMAELDLGRSVLAREEAEWLRSADRVQEAEAGAAEAERALQELKDGQAARREEIAALQAECHDRMGAAERERAQVAKGLSPAALTRYDRIRRGRAPLALYAMHGDACGHCFTAVPMHRRQELQAGLGIVMCEACGVLIYNAEAVPPP
jgi:predicted  nucleic acid-binding Zn-ribbon protein